MLKKILAFAMAATLCLTTVGCGKSAKSDGGSKSGLIKVGIINNDPNDSGYRTANDKDMKATFTK